MQKLSVLLPAYNLGRNIHSNLKETCSAIEKVHPNYELVLIDDGSIDDTVSQARKLRSDRVKIVHYPRNQGKGNALKQGFKHSIGDLVCFIDSDLDIHPKQLGTFLSHMRDTDADVVIGSKRHPDSLVKYPFHRKALSSAYSLLNSVLFDLNVSDTQVGFKLMKRHVLEQVMHKLIVKRYAFDLELLANIKKKGFRIVEAPVVLDYQGVTSYVNPMAIWNILVDTFAIAYRMHVLDYYADKD